METRGLAEKLLAETWGGAVVLAAPESLGGSNRSHVIRYQVEAGPGEAPTTLVVKHAAPGDGERFDPDAADGPASRAFNDWAGLQFLSECLAGQEPLPIPRFIAGDRDNGLIVMHDIGAGDGLHHFLLGSDAGAAARCLTDLMTTLGRVHAATCGKQERYDAIRDRLGPRVEKPLAEHVAWHVENQPRGLAWLGVTPPDGFAAAIEEMVQEFRGDSAFRVYCHHDPCPDNVLWIGGQMTLLDFEFSGMGNAAVDMRYPRAIWPTCWCANRTPPDLRDAVERAYRAELVKGCPEAGDDAAFYRQLAAGCAEASLGMLGHTGSGWMERMALLGDFVHAQKLLARLEAFAEVSERHGHFPVLGQVARQGASALRGRLPGDFREMPVYPAFR